MKRISSHTLTGLIYTHTLTKIRGYTLAAVTVSQGLLYTEKVCVRMCVYLKMRCHHVFHCWPGKSCRVCVCVCVSGRAICSPSFRPRRVLTKMILNQQSSSLTCDQAIWQQYLTLATVNVIELLPPVPPCVAMFLNRTFFKDHYKRQEKNMECGGERRRNN